MKYAVKSIVTFITIIAGIAAIIGVYFQIKEKQPVIEIKTISLDKLTEIPSIEGLKATYIYKQDTVGSLWKLHYIVANIGDETIIGEGNKKNIIKNNIKFFLNKNFKILDVKKNEGIPFEISFDSSNINLSFLQWKNRESFELVLYAEQLESKDQPSLITNEREIINGRIVYSSLLKEEHIKTSIFNKLPIIPRQILRWITILIFGILAFSLPILWVIELVKVIKYKKWKKNSFWLYSEWINGLMKEGKLEDFTLPRNLPDKFWADYPYIKPVYPDNDEFGYFSLGFLFALVAIIVPLLLAIEI